jgi:hypothetical protein
MGKKCFEKDLKKSLDLLTDSFLGDDKGFVLFTFLLVVFLLLYAGFGFYYCILFEGSKCTPTNWGCIALSIFLVVTIITAKSIQ